MSFKYVSYLHCNGSSLFISSCIHPSRLLRGESGCVQSHLCLLGRTVDFWCERCVRPQNREWSLDCLHTTIPARANTSCMTPEQCKQLFFEWSFIYMFSVYTVILAWILLTFVLCFCHFCIYFLSLIFYFSFHFSNFGTSTLLFELSHIYIYNSK